MKQYLKQFFNSFNLFDYILLPLFLVAVLTVSIIYKCDALSIIYSFVGLIAVFVLSKGVFFSPIFLIIMYIIYAIQAYLSGLYGEVILNVAILMPLQIYAFISWFIKRKHKAEKSLSVSPQDIHLKEWSIIAVCYVLLLISVYFILQAINTNYLILSALCFANAILANYLTIRKSFYQFVVYIANNVVLILMWLMPLIEGQPLGTNFLPMIVSFVAFTAINSYGLINWIKLSKKSKNLIANKQTEEV